MLSRYGRRFHAALSITRLTAMAVQAPPRGVWMPRRFSTAAISRSVEQPASGSRE